MNNYTPALRLFKAVKVEEHKTETPDSARISATLADGYIVDPSIELTENLQASLKSLFGLTGVQANSAFHKSWEKVRSAKIETLVMEQVLHYITSYGYRRIGINLPWMIYIPREARITNRE